MSWSSFSGHCVLSRSDSPGSVSLNLSGSASLRVQEVHTWWMPLIFLTWQLSIILSVFAGRLSKLLSVIQEWSQVIYMCLLRIKTLNFLKGLSESQSQVVRNSLDRYSVQLSDLTEIIWRPENETQQRLLSRINFPSVPLWRKRWTANTFKLFLFCCGKVSSRNQSELRVWIPQSPSFQTL